MNRILVGALLGLVTSSVGCTNGDSNGTSTGNQGGTAGGCATGAERCACYGNKTCDDGLTCASSLCVKLASATGGRSGNASSAASSAVVSGGNPQTVINGSAGATPGSTSSSTTTMAGTSSAPAGANAGASAISMGGNATTTALSQGGTGGSAMTRPLSAGGAGGAVGLVTGGMAGYASTSSTTAITAAGNGNQPSSCEGLREGGALACAGSAVQAMPIPLDLILLVDRSVSNGYAFGSETALPPASGAMTRWDVYIAAMEALAVAPQAQGLRVSLTFFSLNGGNDPASNCETNSYASPVVPLAPLATNGSQLVNAMQVARPAGLTPSVPALTGVYLYAMAEKKKDPTRDKVVVFLSDGFPTLCDHKAPSDVASVIKEAAQAPLPIRTFIIGTGSPNTIDGGKFNLQNYARAGNTSKPPILLDETQGANAVKQQLMTALLAIANSNSACEFAITPPSDGTTLDTTRLLLRYVPATGGVQEIPKRASAGACTNVNNGGWYFDDPVHPTKISVCPCTCSMLGTGTVSLIHGCATP